MSSTGNSATNSTTQIGEREFVMERIFDAPRELVFKAWSEPKHVTQWWGPKGWTLPYCRMDFRPGGVWVYGMRGPDGTEGWGRATYREIVEPERIVYVDAFADEHGEPLEGMPETTIIVEFIDLGGKTKLKSTAQFASRADLEQTVGMGMEEGMGETWDRLSEYLPTLQKTT
jgi:uncharacterized protein YndB with AHSA1/START domain